MSDHKIKERNRRRSEGFKLKQVWVHEDDEVLFKEFIKKLPNNFKHIRPNSKKLKMPGMTK